MVDPRACPRAGRRPDPWADPARIGGQIIDAIGNRPAKLLDQEVVDPHRLGIALRSILPAVVLEVADQFFLLRIDRGRSLLRPEIAGWFSATACFTSVLM